MTDQDKDTIIQQQRDIIALMQNPVMVVNPNLRDQFAMAALTGLLSNSEYSHTTTSLANEAYNVADVMMKVREEKK